MRGGHHLEYNTYNKAHIHTLPRENKPLHLLQHNCNKVTMRPNSCITSHLLLNASGLCHFVISYTIMSPNQLVAKLANGYNLSNFGYPISARSSHFCHCSVYNLLLKLASVTAIFSKMATKCFEFVEPLLVNESVYLERDSELTSSVTVSLPRA